MLKTATTMDKTESNIAIVSTVVGLLKKKKGDGLIAKDHMYQMRYITNKGHILVQSMHLTNSKLLDFHKVIITV